MIKSSDFKNLIKHQILTQYSKKDQKKLLNNKIDIQECP